MTDVQTAYPIFTGLTWTDADTNYFLPIAEKRVNADIPSATEDVKVLATCYYIASMHQAGSVNVTSESLGDHSYTIRSGKSLDSWGDRYNAIVSQNTHMDACEGIENPEVPKELRLDRW